MILCLIPSKKKNDFMSYVSEVETEWEGEEGGYISPYL
jgi:hypothetical protein